MAVFVPENDVSLSRIVAWNTVVQVAGRLLGLVLSVLLTALMTRYLGLASYGKLVAATTYVSLFAILGESGLYLAVVRRAAQEPERRATILGTALALRLLMALVPLVLAVIVAQLIPVSRFPTYDALFKRIVVLAALNAYVTLLNQFMIAIFRLHLRMDLSVLGETIQRVVMMGGVLLVMSMHGSLTLVMLALLAGSGANLAFGWMVGKRFESFRPRYDAPMARALLLESAVLSMVTILGLIHFKVDTLLLSLLQPAQDVGVYGVAYRVHEVIITFPALFVGLLYPVFARLAAEDPARLRRVFQRSFDVLLLASLGMVLLVYVLAPTVADLLGAAQAAAPMRILGFAMPGVFLALGLSHLLLAEGRQRWLVGLYAVLALVNIAANLVFIRLYSYRGAAAVTVATETLGLACLLGYWVGKRRWQLELRCLWGVPLAVGLGALFAAASQRWMPAPGEGLVARLVGLAIMGLGCAGLYLTGVLAFRLLPRESLQALWPGARRADPLFAPAREEVQPVTPDR